MIRRTLPNQRGIGWEVTMQSREVRRSSAANQLDSLVFNLDVRCDKRCSMCCVSATPSRRAANHPLETIARRIRNTPAPPLLCSLCNGALGNVGMA